MSFIPEYKKLKFVPLSKTTVRELGRWSCLVCVVAIGAIKKVHRKKMVHPKNALLLFATTQIYCKQKSRQ